MEPMGKDSPTHNFLSTADLSPFTLKEIPEHFNGSLFFFKIKRLHSTAAFTALHHSVCCSNAGVSQPAVCEDRDLGDAVKPYCD